MVKAILAALTLLALVSLGLTATSHTTLSSEAKANGVSIDIKSFDFNPNRIPGQTAGPEWWVCLWCNKPNTRHDEVIYELNGRAKESATNS